MVGPIELTGDGMKKLLDATIYKKRNKNKRNKKSHKKKEE